MFTSSFRIPPPCISFEARGMITTPRLISLLTAEIYCGDIVCETGGTSWVCGLGSRHITQYDITRGKTGNIISVTSQPSFLAINSLDYWVICFTPNFGIGLLNVLLTKYHQLLPKHKVGNLEESIVA